MAKAHPTAIDVINHEGSLPQAVPLTEKLPPFFSFSRDVTGGTTTNLAYGQRKHSLYIKVKYLSFVLCN